MTKIFFIYLALAFPLLTPKSLAMPHPETIKLEVGFTSRLLKPLKVLQLEKNEGHILHMSHQVGEFIQPNSQFYLSIQYPFAMGRENLTQNSLDISDGQNTILTFLWNSQLSPTASDYSIRPRAIPKGIFITGQAGVGGYNGVILDPSRHS